MLILFISFSSKIDFFSFSSFKKSCKYLQLFLNDEKEKKSIFDEKEINKINTFREKKNLKRIQNLPTHDSVCVDYKVGFFGIKYLK